MLAYSEWSFVSFCCHFRASSIIVHAHLRRRRRPYILPTIIGKYIELEGVFYWITQDPYSVLNKGVLNSKKQFKTKILSGFVLNGTILTIKRNSKWVNKGPGMRTIILLIYSQYNILQYSCVTIQYIAIFLNANTIYCNIPQRQYNILQYSSATIQYILAIFVSYNTIYCIVMTNQYNILSGIYCNILQLIFLHRRTSYTTRYAYLHVSGSITRRTIYCNNRVRQYNILQYSSPTIQYIAIFVTPNTIYCIVRTHRYNILLTIYCNIL